MKIRKKERGKVNKRKGRKGEKSEMRKRGRNERKR